MKPMLAWYAGLNERERRFVAAGAVLVGALLLVGGLLLPLHSAASAAVRRSESRRQDLEWMRLNAPEIRAGASQLRGQSAEPPVVLVDRTGREAGLTASLRGTQPSGATGVRVQLESAPFDTLMIWLGTLTQRYGLAVESITVDRAAKPGTVNASVTLTQPKR